MFIFITLSASKHVLSLVIINNSSLLISQPAKSLHVRCRVAENMHPCIPWSWCTTIDGYFILHFFNTVIWQVQAPHAQEAHMTSEAVCY
jgi:hypothetical protein